MQSASPSDRLVLGGGRMAGRVRESLSGGRAWSFVLVLLLTLTVAESTNSFDWVDGIAVVVPIALLGAGLMGALALTPLPESIALAIGFVVGVPLAILGAWPEIEILNPKAVLGLQLLNLWAGKLGDGTLWSDKSFYLVLIALLMWVTGAWLAWCVLRWRKPMLGLIPGAAAFSTNALNILPGMPDQNGFAFAMVVLTVILLLWNNYSTSILSAARMRVRLTGDAKWDFWESGLVAMLVVVVVGMFAPQMSKSDRTTQVESGIFTSWAQLQAEISHPGVTNANIRGGGTTGFSDEVKLVGSISRNGDPVFVYSPAGVYGGPVYFRGLNITKQEGREWRYDPVRGLSFPLAANQPVVYGDQPPYDALGVAAFTAKMVRAPVGFSNVVFYPGQDAKVERATVALQVPLSTFNPDLMSIDRLNVAAGNTGTYTVYSEYSGATDAQLQLASTNYPEWVKQFAVTPETYRSPAVLDKERQLALSITAGKTNPYDIATAIQNYLRDNYKYDLNAPTDLRYDPIDYFLFQSKIGYCEYFASAMGDMLRLLGIPTRLVNGFGPGTFDSIINSYVVKASDAHTWVEVYFPGFGWIPFEPTPQNGYNVPSRGSSSANVCLRENGCDQPDTGTVPPVGGVNGPTAGPHHKNTTSGGSNGRGLSVASLLTPSLFTDSLALILAAVLILLILAVRYLRPRSVMAVWNRMLVLASLAGAERRTGETPLELGRRLERVFPEAAEPVAALIGGFTIAAYAPPDEAAGARSTVMEAWTQLRPQLLRRVFRRLRPQSQ